MRGISFKAPNKYGHILIDILNGVDLNLFQWNVMQADIIWSIPQKGLSSFFDVEQNISGSELIKQITKDDYYVLFIVLKAFPLDSKIMEINNYRDFLHSDCQLALLIYDVTNVEIYCKEDRLLKIITDNIINNGYSQIEEITEENNLRTEFYVL